MTKPKSQPSTKETQALRELSRFDARTALALLEASEAKKRKEQFIRYWQPYPKQMEAIAKFDKDCKELVIRGGNRAGKTTPSAAIGIAYLLGKDYFRDFPAWEWVQHLPIAEDRPRAIWCVGLTFDMVRDVIWNEKMILGKGQPAFLPKDFEKEGGKIRLGDFQLVAADGSVLTCKSADAGATRFQAASIDLVLIDEECDSAVYDECYQRTVDCGGRILTTLTPLSDISSGVDKPWVFEKVQDAVAGVKGIRTAQLSVFDNPAVPEEEKENLRRKWQGHPEERARLYGDFISRSGLVYPMWKHSVHMVERREIPKSWFRIACIDPAATGPTACTWTAIDPDNGDRYLYRTYKDRDLAVSEHAKQILLDNAFDKVDLWLIDPRWGQQRNAETHKTGAQLYKDCGIPVRCVPIQNIGVENEFAIGKSTEFLMATLDTTARHDRHFFFDDLHDFRDEIEKYVWAVFGKGDQKGMTKGKPRKGNDDLLNCWQYTCCVNPPRRQFANVSQEEARQRARVNSYS